MTNRTAPTINQCRGVHRCLQGFVIVFALLVSGCGFIDSSDPWDQWDALSAGERVSTAELTLLRACHDEPDTSDADCNPQTSDVVPAVALTAPEPGWYGTTFVCGGNLQFIRLRLHGDEPGLILWIGPIWDDRPLDEYASFAETAFGDRVLTSTSIDIAGTQGVQIQASEGIQLIGSPEGSPWLDIPATFILFKAESDGLFFAVIPHAKGGYFDNVEVRAAQVEIDTFVSKAIALTDTLAVDVPRTRSGCI
jgi:hypothetical protein